VWSVCRLVSQVRVPEPRREQRFDNTPEGDIPWKRIHKTSRLAAGVQTCSRVTVWPVTSTFEIVYALSDAACGNVSDLDSPNRDETGQGRIHRIATFGGCSPPISGTCAADSAPCAVMYGSRIGLDWRSSGPFEHEDS